MGDPAKPIEGERNSPEVEAAWRAAPPQVVAEIVGGVLHTMPRPARRHTIAATNLGEELGPPFKRGRGGPGGWVILDEPEIHLGAMPDIVVPDLAGWRRERMPDAAGGEEAPPYYELAPDWACEVLSPRTEAFDRGEKVPLYARERGRHVWLVDPIEQTLEVFRLDGERYSLVGVHHGAARVRAEPFDAIELDLAVLWAG
ncbi:MAG: Uma2 family endonuclease [Labilithrix sp.]|nr:Uma2 family endonuclease [Labilithrix sp.]